MRFQSLPIASMLFVVLSSHQLLLAAQNDQDRVAQTILDRDQAFWDAYNQCDTDKMRQFFTPDVEFYHDKGGITLGLEPLIASTQKNLCSNENFRVRREAVPGTVKVFLLREGGTTYGAVLSGDHYFYVLETGKAERRDGLAKFFHVWLLKDGLWKMARVISYDHQPAPYLNTRKTAVVPAAVLDRYVGTYLGQNTGTVAIARTQDTLTLAVGNNIYVLYPESDRVFFEKDRDLTFEFVTDEKAKVVKLVVRENGNVAEELSAKK